MPVLSDPADFAHFAHKGLRDFVAESIQKCAPARVFLCDGSAAEYDALIARMLEAGDVVPLTRSRPGCYLHRSHPDDVARVEERTFICSDDPGDAGPTNRHWDPKAAHETLDALFENCMRGRTMFIVPFVMGPPDSPLALVGVEITDSAYVAASMRIMTRMGRVALDKLGADGDFIPCLHSLGQLDPQTRYICHFTDEMRIESFGSGYGGNALLGKKCLALRMASKLAQKQGWLAEHMLILELSGPNRRVTYFAGAFPSACGKTNLAMLVSPYDGWSVRTVGDDIAWMRVGDDGQLWAMNPEAGFFGVAPGTSDKSNPTAMRTIQSDTIFTNVAVTESGDVWWEGLSDLAPGAVLTDWKGNVRTIGDDGKPTDDTGPLAHPNARFTAPATNCPTLSPRWDDGFGVPISAILWGGRRDTLVPLVVEAIDWNHGVFLGATMASQTTAAAAGKVGVLRRDPMAMLPFCGYNMGDYFAHWLEIGEKLTRPPKMYHVNWFRKDAAGKFIWPGFGENVRVLMWIESRLGNETYACPSALGGIPFLHGFWRGDNGPDSETLQSLWDADIDGWRIEANAIETYFATFGDRFPQALHEQLAALRARLDDPPTYRDLPQVPDTGPRQTLEMRLELLKALNFGNR